MCIFYLKCCTKERERGGGRGTERRERKTERGETKRQRQAENRETDKEHTSCIFTQLMNMYRPQDYNSTYPSCTYAGFLEIREREREYKQLSKFET